MASYTRRDIRGGAVPTTLASGINSGDTSFTLAASTGWPDGSVGDFFVVIDRGTASEEKIRCSTRTTVTCNVQTSGRGADGTSAAAHSSGAPVEHCVTAVDVDEANYAVVKTVGQITSVGDLLVGDAANSAARLAVGTTGLPLVAGASSPSYTALGTSGIADDAVTAAKIVASGVGSSEIADGAVGTSEFADQAVTTAKLLDLGVTTAKIADLNVTTGKIALLGVDTGQLAANAVTTAKITDLNVTTAKIADSAVTTAKIADANVTAAKLEASIPLGKLGYAAVTANQTGISTITDLTSLAVTVTVGTSRYIRISSLAVLSQNTSAGVANLTIREGATQLANSGGTFAAGDFWSGYTSVIVSPTPGSHTYKLSASTNGGTLNLNASATQPAYILVEDIGA